MEVEYMCQSVKGRKHVVNVDKFYMSIPLAYSLLNKGVYL